MDPSSDRSSTLFRRNAADNNKVRTRKSTHASMMIALTMMGKNVLAEYIDSMCTYDVDRRNLNPREVVLILIGAIMLRNGRIPLYRIWGVFEHMPVRTPS